MKGGDLKNTHLAITLDNLNELNHILDSEFYDKLVLLKQTMENSVKLNIKSHNDKLYKCHKCNYTAKHSSNLTSHFRLTHTEERPWKCMTCRKSFGRSDYLRKHMRCHTGEKPHICSICSRRFKQRSGYTSHLKHVHNCSA